MPALTVGPSKRAQPQAEVHEDLILRAITPAVLAGLDDIGDLAREFLLNILSVPVEYDGNRVIRSAPGSPPRMEEDMLRQSTDTTIHDDGPLPSLEVSVGPRPGGDANAAVVLEFGGQSSWGRIEPRPFMGPTRDYIEGIALATMQAAFKRVL